MNGLDALIIVAVGGAGLGGFRLGFLARVTSWIGLGAGLIVAARCLPAVVRLVGGAEPAARLLLAAVVLVGGAFAGQAIGLLAGTQLRKLLPIGGLRTGDRVVGAVVGGLGVIASVWLLLPAMADVPGLVSRQARTSAIAHQIDRGLPDAPDTLQSLRTLVGDTNFPQVFSDLTQSPDAGPPPSAIPVDPSVVERVKRSTVKIEGKACSRIQDGSGFVVAQDVVITNAHVVAGDRGSIYAIRNDLSKVKATVTMLDTDRDLAVLHAPGLGLTPLPIVAATVKEGTVGAIFGHPGGQDAVRVAPAAVSKRVDAVGKDLYGRHQTRRDVFVLAANLAPGDSGAAVANQAGEVMAVAFAIAPDRNGVAYALTDKELKAAIAQDTQSEVSTGPCLVNA